MPPAIHHKACDLCYTVKKRCLISPGTSACVRCRKSSVACTTSRQQPRPGRPPNRGLAGVTRGLLGLWDLTLSQPTRPVSDALDKYEVAPQPASTSSVHYTFPDPTGRPNDFNFLVEIYMLGSTFSGDFHRAVEYCSRHSPGLLDEIFLALESSLLWARLALFPAEQVDVRSGAVSVRKLCNTKISNAHDALGYLMLGQALAAFNSLIMSTGTPLILRSTLSLVRPWYPDIARVHFLEPVSIPPIFWDTVWCLLHREVPIIRPVLSRRGVVDRVAGICTSLLPTLFELCVFSWQQRDGLAHDDMLNRIEQQIRTWVPESDLLLGQYSPLEILSMRTQANMYRTASLLLIHRLRQPLTPVDPIATALANEILEARAQFFTAAGPSAKLQHTVFPTFLALLEVPSPIECMWENSTWLRTRPACMDGLVAFNQYFCEQRRLGFNGSLFDLVQTGPDFASFP